MFISPVVVHLSRLVDDVGDPPKEEDFLEEGESTVSLTEEEESSKDDTVAVASIRLPGKKVPTRKPIRIRRAKPAKAEAERTRESRNATSSTFSSPTRDIKKIKIEHELSRVDTKLGGIDPFCAFDTSECPQDRTTNLALHHWVSVFQNTRMPITPRQPWMRINLSDKTLLSVTIYCSLQHFYFIRGLRAPPQYYPMKVIAIRNINDTLRQIPSDHAMVAVAVMTLLECVGGEPTEWVVHRKGLQLMINLRGGLENLGFGGGAQRTISWADTCCAILLRINPSLQPKLVPSAGESAIPGFTVGDLKERLLRLTSSVDLSSRIIYIYLRLRYLTQLLATLPFSKVDEYHFSDKIDFIERGILVILNSEDLANSNSSAFLTAFLNASLIYVYEELREVPRWNNVCLCLGSRIHSGLELVDLDIITAACPDLLLWLLMLGRSGSNPLTPGTGKNWFLRQIAVIERGFEVNVPPSLAGVNGMMYFELAEATMVKPESEEVVEQIGTERQIGLGEHLRIEGDVETKGNDRDAGG